MQYPPPVITALLAVVFLVLAVEPTATADPMGRQQYLKTASTAESLANKWWDRRTALYKLQLGRSGPATIWGGAVHMFEVENALAIADPSRVRKNKVRWFARNAERYWNPNLPPLGGYTPTPGSRWAKSRAWFDDKLVIDRTDVVLRSTDFPAMKFNQFLMTPYFGPGLLPHEQTLWIDELSVSTRRLPEKK